MSVKNSECVPPLWWSPELSTKSQGRIFLWSFKLTLNLPKLRQEHSFNSPGSHVVLSQLILPYMAHLLTTSKSYDPWSLKPWLRDKIMTVEVSGSTHPEIEIFFKSLLFIFLLLLVSDFDTTLPVTSIVTVYVASTVCRKAWECELYAPKPLETWKTKYANYVY